MIAKTGATANTGKIIATDNSTYIKVEITGGAFIASDNIEGLTTGATATVNAGIHDRARGTTSSKVSLLLLTSFILRKIQVKQTPLSLETMMVP